MQAVPRLLDQPAARDERLGRHLPAAPSPNVPLVQKDFILKRAHECIVERGKIPNLIMTDFYNRGQVVQAANELNGVGTEKPAPINPVAMP